ncbi:FAD binding domain-containing protein [Histidinibacterium aquaticum]|uniref:Xanthine dehydrogenase family protein subunit M n=1 Tax=Histidinibacterium aquaticum TaxID=2613962 RepID=A0A5J5GJ92_9RHOB|nr:xanthine dehydrogenase family protein subunit M [Histidinibacterium aquaticum]KAA9008120.1 xanthine dehydrogenase family protein subunit M [Histidinibacterium aquaticum]
MLGFDYARPEKFDDVIALLLEAGPEALMLAGGTDLVVALRHHVARPRLVIDLKRVEGFRAEIREEDGSLVVPAGTTMTEIVRDRRIQALFAALVEAANVVGSIQIRNRATLAGNICNASPAADTVPLLALYGASVEIAGTSGTRLSSVEDFVRGNRDTDLGEGEVVTAVRLPLPRQKTASTFERITRRRGVDLATVNLGCLLQADGTVRYALGAVAPRPLLVEGGGDPETLFDVATPITDVRAGADYRRAMLNVIAERALARARSAL